MQTFLPYPDFQRSAAALDYRRLGKQRLEARQLLRLLRDPSVPSGWRNHPAARMWRGYEDALAAYLNAVISEWTRRGYRNTMTLEPVPDALELPWWLGNPTFHAAHRANLLRKDPAYYGQFGWREPPDLPYIWPVSDISGQSATDNSGRVG